MEQNRILFEQMDWQDGIHGARFKLHRTDGQQIRLLELAAEFVEPDWCEKAHTGYVLEGELEIDFRGSLVRYPAGSALCISGGAENSHKARSLTPVTRIFLVEEI